MEHAFIFARGGSKGLPGKNVKPLAGKPLIQYSIELAQKIPVLDKVFVSTDDAEIAAIASALGAIVIDRPMELAGDTSSEWFAWRHAIEWVVEYYGNFDGFTSLPATSPLRNECDVVSAINKRNQTASDMCISVTEASRSPYFNMVRPVDNELVELVNKPDLNVSRRQDAPEVFDITTVVYATTPDFVLNNSSMFEGRVTSVVVPKERSVDIDDIYDFLLAEAILNYGEDINA